MPKDVWKMPPNFKNYLKTEKYSVDTKKSVLGVKNSKTAIWLNHHITASSASVFEKNKLFGKDFLFPRLDWIDFQCFCRVNLWDKKTYNHILCPRKLAKYIPRAIVSQYGLRIMPGPPCINKNTNTRKVRRIQGEQPSFFLEKIVLM